MEITREELQAKVDSHNKWLRNESDGQRLILRGANLCGAYLCDADLCGADLCGAYLCGADLCGADLCGADLCGADLCGANLRGANLRGANLRDADLCSANLRDANLRDADLCGTNLDYSCWPLWCGSLGVKTDKRLACQLAYHLCSLECDDPEFIKMRNSILNFANQFHRAAECGRLEEKKGAANVQTPADRT